MTTKTTKTTKTIMTTTTTLLTLSLPCPQGLYGQADKALSWLRREEEEFATEVFSGMSSIYILFNHSTG